jgi:hypothetical protein
MRVMGNKIENVAIGSPVLGGGVAATAGVIEAGSSTTGAIDAAGAAVGAGDGAVTGLDVGVVTAGVGLAATASHATAGAAIGAWAGPALALVGICQRPVLAVPVAIGGGVLATGGLAMGGYKWIKARNQKGDPE